MHLVHDLLDTLVYDRHRTPIGRVDGIQLELHAGEAPRVTAVRIGGNVLARRLGERVARWTAALRQSVRGAPPTPTCIAIASLARDGVEWRVDDLDVRDTPAFGWELWLRAHVVARLPGRGT